MNVYAASYASGIQQVSGDVNLAELFPWAVHKLVVEGVPTETRRLADLPPEAAIDRASWEALSTKSSLMVPIVTGGVRDSSDRHGVDNRGTSVADRVRARAFVCWAK